MISIGGWSWSFTTSIWSVSGREVFDLLWWLVVWYGVSDFVCRVIVLSGIFASVCWFLLSYFLFDYCAVISAPSPVGYVPQMSSFFHPWRFILECSLNSRMRNWSLPATTFTCSSECCESGPNSWDLINDLTSSCDSLFSEGFLFFPANCIASSGTQ